MKPYAHLCVCVLYCAYIDVLGVKPTLIKDLQWMQNSKLKKLSEHIHALEEKLQNAYNENAKLKVKHQEDEKLWKGLESKFFSTKTLCDQLTETLQLLSDQVQDGKRFTIDP